MRHHAILAFAAWAFATAAFAQAPAPGSGFVEILSANFGVINTGADGKKAFKQSDLVPYKVGQEYGWVIRLRTNKPSVHVREELDLPGPAKSWGGPGPAPPDIAVASDRRSAVVESDLSPQDGLIFRGWSVAAGDPTGSYVIRVTLDGQLRQFNFEVQ
jgi:hypothetical protein